MFACMSLDRALNSSCPVIVLKFELLMFELLLLVMIITHLYMLMLLTYQAIYEQVLFTKKQILRNKFELTRF